MQKTNYRWLIIGILFALNAVSYIDRSAMAYVAHTIMTELHLTYTEMGAILGAFGGGYLLSTFFGGIIVDRYGAKKILLVFSLVWAFAIGATGLAIGFLSAYLARFCLGLGEGPNFPAVARTVNDWLPPAAKAKALANALVAVPLSLALGGPFIAMLLSIVNWHWMFFILALMILIWWPFWWFFYADSPTQSRFVNSAEQDYINPKPLAKNITEAKNKPQGTWRFFFTNPTLLSNNWAFFVFGYSTFFFISWLPSFLEQSYQLNIKEVGLFSFLPWSLGALFLWGVGYGSDVILKKTGKLRYARSYPIMIGQLLSLLSLLPILFSHDRTIALICISLAVAFSLSNNTTFYAINVDIAKRRAGSSLGLMNSGFAIAGFIAPTLTGWSVQVTGSFQTAFGLLALLICSSLITVYVLHQPDQEKTLTSLN